MKLLLRVLCLAPVLGIPLMLVDMCHDSGLFDFDNGLVFYGTAIYHGVTLNMAYNFILPLIF